MSAEIENDKDKAESAKSEAPASELSPSELDHVTGGTGEVVSPRDAASGLPAGKRDHKPLSVTI